MLTFTLYTEDPDDRGAEVHVDPAAVVAVRESERRPAFRGWHQVAILTLSTGVEFLVEDGARNAAKRIREARAAVG